MMGPVPWFLATPPSPSPEMVIRESVRDRLDSLVASHRATVVSAPSGFGKTVAVSQWAARAQDRCTGSVSWLTLTDRVTGVGDVLRGILTALQTAARERADAGLYQALAAVFETTSYPAAFELTAAIDSPDPVTIVIDDFQNARDVMADPYFADFIEHGPQFLRLVLITTDAAGTAWSRLRMHQHVAVIGADQLVLSASEIGALAALAHRRVTPEEADDVLAATAGWPAAVRLALVAGDRDPGSLAGTDLTDYIQSAVLGRMRSDLADFALSTTVAERLDGALAGALAGRSDADVLLGECLSAGLFIQRFASGDDTVYRWHSMFATHCRAILRRTDPLRWRTLNAVAARELQDRYPLPAVDHAIDADEAALATNVLANHWLELLLQSRSEALEHSCIAAIQAFGEQPELLMIRACCRDLSGDRLNAGLLFARGRELADGAAPSTRMSFIADLTEVLLSDDAESMAAAADRTQATLADSRVVTPVTYACALFLLGWAKSRLRHGQPGHALLEAAVHECRVLGLTELAERARQNLGIALALAGEFDRALEATRRGPDDGSDPALWLSHDGGGIDRFTEGFVQFWHGELDSARDAFIELDATVGSGYPDTGRMMLAHTVATLGDTEGLDNAERAVGRLPESNSHGVPWTSYRIAAQAHLLEMRGAHTEALQLAAKLVGEPHLAAMSAIVSGVCRRLGAPELARQLARAAADDLAQPYSRAYGQLTLALLDWEAGRSASAHRNLEVCLSLAAPESVRYPFIDNAGPACVELLAAHASSSTGYPEFLDECLRICERIRTDKAARPDTLTPRERQVLTYLRKQMTANEIAAQMAVSINTVKTHQRAIYRKLGVRNRREAIRLVRD